MDTNFKNYIEKLEYVGENLKILFEYTDHNDIWNITEYKEIILINFLKDLIKSDDSAILNSLDQIILQECKKNYYNDCRKYKHYPNEDELISKLKSIEKRSREFMDFIKLYEQGLHTLA